MYQRILDDDMKAFKRMLAEAENLNCHRANKTLNPDLFEMATNLGDKLVSFAGKLKAISLPIIMLSEVLEKVLG